MGVSSLAHSPAVADELDPPSIRRRFWHVVDAREVAPNRGFLQPYDDFIDERSG